MMVIVVVVIGRISARRAFKQRRRWLLIRAPVRLILALVVLLIRVVLDYIFEFSFVCRLCANRVCSFRGLIRS